VTRPIKFAIAGAITCFTFVAGACPVGAETTQQLDLRKAELTDAQLPGGMVVADVLRRVQEELDGRRLTDASQRQMEELVGKYPSNYKLHLYLGLVFDELGLPDQAVAEYELADKLGPNDPRATAGIMNHILARHESQAATVLLEKSLKRFPNSPEILYFMGKNFKDNKHWYAAERVLKQAYDSGSKIKHLAAELGEMYEEIAPDKAIKLADEELAQYPKYPLALQVKAAALINQGKFEQAIVPLQNLYDQSPSYARTAEDLLRCRYWCGHYKAAMQPALYFLRKEAQYQGGPLVSAEVLSNMIRTMSASFIEEQLNQFYARLAKDKMNVRPAFHYYLADMLYKRNLPHTAKSELVKFLAEDPKSVDGLYLLGKLEENYAHNYTDALRYYEMAHAMSPYNLEINGAYTRMVEKQSFQSSDWARSFRDWLSRIFTPPLD